MTDPAPASAPSRPRGASPRFVGTALPLALLAALLLAGQRAFTIQEDEVLIAQQSLLAVRDILAPFLVGGGHHAHPPLSDLILHFWLVATGGSLVWLRVLDIAVYLAGVAVLGLAAERLGGPRARTALHWTALLWPFGFHYAWLFGWFSFGFFLVALVTWLHAGVRELPTLGRWLGLVLAAAALVWTNYYGWALLGLLGVDYLLAGPGTFRQKALVLGVAVVLVGLAFLPLVRPLLDTVSERTDVAWAFPARALYAGWLGYAFFASESIAPWVFALSVPAALATAAVLALLVFRGPAPARRAVAGFVLLLLVMSLLGGPRSKRIFFLGPWLLLAVALFLAGAAGRVRAGLIAALGVLAALGWFGFASRKYYGALRFFDPWPEVIEAVAPKLQGGATVISYHPSFFFYLTYRLQLPADVRPWRLTGLLPRTVSAPGVFEPVQFLKSGAQPTGDVLFIKSAGFIERQEEARPLEELLGARCRLTGTTGYLPDEHSELKRRFGEDKGHLPWRIQVVEYACPPRTA